MHSDVSCTVDSADTTAPTPTTHSPTLTTVNIILIAVAAALFAVIVIGAIVAAVYFGRRLFRSSAGIKPNENPERPEGVTERMPPRANGRNQPTSFNNRSPGKMSEYPEYRVGAHKPGRATGYVLGATPPTSFTNHAPSFYGSGYGMSKRY